MCLDKVEPKMLLKLQGTGIVITEKVKKTREGRGGEKEDNMTRLQQLALLEGCP